MQASYQSKTIGPVIGFRSVIGLLGELSDWDCGCQLTASDYKTSCWFKSTYAVIDLYIRNQLLIHIYRTSYQFLATTIPVVISLYLQGQFLVHIYRSSEQPISTVRLVINLLVVYLSTGPLIIIGLYQQGQLELSVHIDYRPGQYCCQSTTPVTCGVNKNYKNTNILFVVCLVIIITIIIHFCSHVYAST